MIEKRKKVSKKKAVTWSNFACDIVVYEDFNFRTVMCCERGLRECVLVGALVEKTLAGYYWQHCNTHFDTIN